MAMGLLEDDREWVLAFDEAKHVSTGRQLRAMFVLDLQYNDISSPSALWEQFKRHIYDDLLYRIQQIPSAPQFPHCQYDYGLFLIDELLSQEGKRLTDFDMPSYMVPWNRHTSFGAPPQLQEDCTVLADDLIPRLNRGQKYCLQRVTAAVEHGLPDRHFFIQGAGGTGKTFLYKASYYHLQRLGRTVLCVASSGIASLLLPNGRTAHSQFQIPLRLDETSTCGVTPNTALGRQLREANLIIWDEMAMQNRIAFEAVHQLLCDLRHYHEQPFGGVPVLLGGDFAQTLPVVPRGSRSAIVALAVRRPEWSIRAVALSNAI